MLLTRLGENSRLIITGDLEQHDRKNEKNGILYLSIINIGKISKKYTKNEIKYKNDFSFVGAYSPVREWIIEYLKSKNYIYWTISLLLR